MESSRLSRTRQSSQPADNIDKQVPEYSVLYVCQCHLTGVLKPLSNGPLYSNTVIGALAVDGWAVTFGTARMAPPSPLLAVPNVTAHPSMASVPTSYYSIWHYNYQCPLKG